MNDLALSIKQRFDKIMDLYNSGEIRQARMVYRNDNKLDSSMLLAHLTNSGYSFTFAAICFKYLECDND